MVNKVITTLLFFVVISVNAQYITRINDPSINGQEKRQVFMQWGDWKPNAKRFLGVNTSVAYASVWGLYAPKLNKKYRKGRDIRPLGPTGQQNQRFIVLKQEQKEVEEIGESVDSIYQRKLADFAHITHLTGSADPLWLLYYKRMLKPLNNFPDKPKNYIEWGFKDDKTFQLAKTNGTITELQEMLDLLKSKYKTSREADMPRGKRFLLYHEILMDWRAFSAKVDEFCERMDLSLKYSNLIKDIKKKKNHLSERRSDSEIVAGIMEKYKHNF